MKLVKICQKLAAVDNGCFTLLYDCVVYISLRNRQCFSRLGRNSVIGNFNTEMKVQNMSPLYLVSAIIREAMRTDLPMTSAMVRHASGRDVMSPRRAHAQCPRIFPVSRLHVFSDASTWQLIASSSMLASWHARHTINTIMTFH